VGSGITGEGGHIIVIDDPVKNREEAESVSARERVWEWYTDDLYTRLEPGGAIILIQTRWHEDDLAGRILASEDGPNWTVLKLPAEAEENDPLGREIGAALCPERYPLDELRAIRKVLTERSYYALYQQAPQPAEGDMFKRDWLPIVALSPQKARRVRYWDYAATAGGSGAYTAGVLIAESNGFYTVEDVRRGRWSTHQRNQVVLRMAERDKKEYGKVQIYVEQEPGSSGVDAIKATIKLLAGYRIRGDKVSGSKDARLGPFADQAEGGFVRLLRAPWNQPYIDELLAVPNGRWRDQSDASAGAFNKLAGKRQQQAYSWEG